MGMFLCVLCAPRCDCRWSTTNSAQGLQEAKQKLNSTCTSCSSLRSCAGPRAVDDLRVASPQRWAGASGPHELAERSRWNVNLFPARVARIQGEFAALRADLERVLDLSVEARALVTKPVIAIRVA